MYLRNTIKLRKLNPKQARIKRIAWDRVRVKLTEEPFKLLVVAGEGYLVDFLNLSRKVAATFLHTQWDIGIPVVQ